MVMPQRVGEKGNPRRQTYPSGPFGKILDTHFNLNATARKAATGTQRQAVNRQCRSNKVPKYRPALILITYLTETSSKLFDTYGIEGLYESQNEGLLPFYRTER